MNIVNIVIIAIILVIIYIILRNTILKTNIVYDKMLDANDEDPQYDAGGGGFLTSATVKKNVIPNNVLNDNFTSNFMISVWFYIDNWGTGIGEEKNVLYLGQSERDTTVPIFKSSSMPGISNVQCIGTDTTQTINHKKFAISLDSFDNNIFIDVKTFKNDECSDDLYTRYKIENIPIQKWNCLTISVDTLLMDVYLDGKLYSSFILPSTFDNDNSSQLNENNIYLGNLLKQEQSSANTTNIGFQGFITRVRYEPNAINTQEALNIYKAGINKSLLSSVFNKYGLKVSFLEYNKEKGSFSI
tara:strand:- start:5962 stop:6861 length:900 start_codon:yes stop_codon:yes gene_type:complete